MARMYRLFAILGVFALLLAACASDGGEVATDTDTDTTTEEAAEEPDASGGGEGGEGDCSSDDYLCVGLVSDVGTIDDKSFNQSAWEGVQGSIADEFDFIETQDSNDYATNIQTFIDQGYDVIVTVGFAIGEATVIAAGENPDVQFIGVDQFQGEAIDNVAGLIFPENQAGFLAGALAGLMTETNTVAQVLGTDLVPPVVAFKEGFEGGAKYTNPDIEIISTYHPGGLDVAFTDPTWGADTARQAIDSGADVIFGAGGLTGNGALGEIAKEGGSVFCIGVDSDQWNTVPEAQPCLITSAMKLITPGVQNLIQAAADGSFAGGNAIGEVGLADYHDFSSVIPQDVQDQIADLTPKVLSGEVPTS